MKSWSTAPMAERNGTPFVSSAKPKLSLEPRRLVTTSLISDDEASSDDAKDWAKPLPMIQYTTSMSSANSSIMLEWTVEYHEDSGAPVRGMERQMGKLCLDEAIPSPPLVTMSSLTLKQPQRKKSLSTRADSPPTLQFTTSLESCQSHWSRKSIGRQTIPAPPDLDHPYPYHDSHHETNEIELPYVSTSIPTNVVEIDGIDVPVRPLEEAILYVAAEVTGSEGRRTAETVCVRCSTTNSHVCDCAYVLCPDCHAVTPAVSASEQHPSTYRWGVGLGFSPDLGAMWLSQLMGGESR